MSSSLMSKAGVAERFEQVLAMTLAGFEASLERYMPAGAYRDFGLWAISLDNPQRSRFLQAMGITQLTQLAVTLLDGLVDDRDWHELMKHGVLLKAYLTYEVVSDNLAIGLASSRKGDTTAALRRDLLRAFNDAMIARLNGDRRPATQLLTAWQPAAKHISNFNQSLNWYKQRACAEAYLSLRDDLSIDDLEFSVWPTLVANIESCAAVAQSMNDYLAGRLLREGLASRYWAVTQLLEGSAMTLPQLADVGTYAILVMPTLAYYIAVLAEIIRPLDRFYRVIEDGTLAQALYDAALLVRLLNDLGTQLVTLPADERGALLNTLMAHHQEQPETTPTLADLLSGFSDGSNVLTRLHKDIAFGEFNVSLYGLADVPAMPETLLTFGNNLAYFSRLYAQRRSALWETSIILRERLDDDMVGTLILRFVQFHEKLYSNSYDMSAGEYAL